MEHKKKSGRGRYRTGDVRKHETGRNGYGTTGTGKRKRRRARKNRRMRTVCLVCAGAVLLIALIGAGVAAARKGRERKQAEEAARAAGADVADMPFSAAGNAYEASGASGNAAGGEGNAPATGNGAAADGQGGTASGNGNDATVRHGATADEGRNAADTGTANVRVEGVSAFSLYRFDEASGSRIRTSRFESAWTRGEDIVSLEAFATDAESFALAAGGGRAWYEPWRTYWYAETGSEQCRIGYRVSFRLKNGEAVDAVLLKPGDELFYRPYLENYLYDDAANADAGWYSHLEPGTDNADTLLTSIKFTPGERFDEIDGMITVTGFVYDSADCFDAAGNYTGDVSFTTELLNR